MTKRVRTTRRLEVWLKDTSVPLFVLNAHRRLVFFNAGCERMTGWSASDVMGQVCEYVSEADVFSSAALLASLAPPANVWRGETIIVPGRLARRNLDPLETSLHFFPLTDVAEKVQAALGIIQTAVTGAALPGVSISQGLHTELAALRHSLREQFDESMLIGQSLGMRRAFGQIQLAQQSTLPVLFVGEAGTGRESMARTIKGASEQSSSPFIPLDCRQLPAEHLESLLKRILNASQSDGFQPAAIYLERVDSLSRDVQRLVLELIESKSLLRPRVMASTLSPLEHIVEAGNFLKDLFYALTSIVISVPSLRDRREDLEPLAQYFLEESNRAAPEQITGFHEDVLHRFRRYNWPGNVGELRMVVNESRQTCSGSLIELDNLPFRFRTGVSGQSIGPALRTRCEPLDPLLLRLERDQIELALIEARHNKAKAAELLGITRPRLYRRMDVLGIIDPDGSLEEPPPTD